MEQNGIRHLGLLAGAAAFSLAVLLAVPSLAVAQDGGFPPFPTLVTGEVYLDGELLAEPGVVTARIGDWESRPVQVTVGRFGMPPGVPIIVGPPTFDYVGQPVTFHLNGELQATMSFRFEALGEPRFLDVTLEFGAPRQQVSPTPTPTPAVAPTPVEDDEAPEVPPTSSETGPSGTSVGTWVLGGAVAGLVGLATVIGLRARRR